jgi:hypothetical protein
VRFLHFLTIVILACTPKADPRVPVTPIEDRIELQFPVDPRIADRVKAAFIQEGLQVATADAGIVTSVPLTPRPDASFPAEYTYRAVVLTSDINAQRVVLSATLRTLKQGDYSTTAPLTSECRRFPGHECYDAWLRLERIAKTLQAK